MRPCERFSRRPSYAASRHVGSRTGATTSVPKQTRPWIRGSPVTRSSPLRHRRSSWIMQVASDLLDPMDDLLRNATHLSHDLDSLFTKARTVALKSRGVKCVRVVW
jgi:hypothetical protein